MTFPSGENVKAEMNEKSWAILLKLEMISLMALKIKCRDCEKRLPENIFSRWGTQMWKLTPNFKWDENKIKLKVKVKIKIKF